MAVLQSATFYAIVTRKTGMISEAGIGDYRGNKYGIVAFYLFVSYVGNIFNFLFLWLRWSFFFNEYLGDLSLVFFYIYLDGLLLVSVVGTVRVLFSKNT